jgi:hypothetical protein
MSFEIIIIIIKDNCSAVAKEEEKVEGMSD